MIKPLATAALVSVAIATAEATAHAGPTTLQPTATVNAADQGVTYTVAATPDGSVIATIDHGRFTAADDGSVVLTDDAGAVVTTIPLGSQTPSDLVEVSASIGNSGRTRALARQSAPAPTRTIDEDADSLARKQHNAVVGALVGGGIGAVLGFFLGGVGALVTIPIGAGIGALIGYSTP